MLMNPSFWIVPVFKKSRARSSRLGAGRLNKRGKVVLALPTRLFATDFFASVVQNEARSAIKEGQDGGQNYGDAGGNHNVEIITSPFAMTGAALGPVARIEHASAEKTPAASKRCAMAANLKRSNNL